MADNIKNLIGEYKKLQNSLINSLNFREITHIAKEYVTLKNNKPTFKKNKVYFEKKLSAFYNACLIYRYIYINIISTKYQKIFSHIRENIREYSNNSEFDIEDIIYDINNNIIDIINNNINDNINNDLIDLFNSINNTVQYNHVEKIKKIKHIEIINNFNNINNDDNNKSLIANTIDNCIKILLAQINDESLFIKILLDQYRNDRVDVLKFCLMEYHYDKVEFSDNVDYYKLLIKINTDDYLIMIKSFIERFLEYLLEFFVLSYDENTLFDIKLFRAAITVFSDNVISMVELYKEELKKKFDLKKIKNDLLKKIPFCDYIYRLNLIISLLTNKLNLEDISISKKDINDPLNDIKLGVDKDSYIPLIKKEVSEFEKKIKEFFGSEYTYLLNKYSKDDKINDEYFEKNKIFEEKIDELKYYDYYYYNINIGVDINNNELINYIKERDNCDILSNEILLKFIYMDPKTINKVIELSLAGNIDPNEYNEYFPVTLQEYKDYCSEKNIPISDFYFKFCIINHGFKKKTKLHAILDKYYQLLNTDKYKGKCYKNDGVFFYDLIYGRMEGNPFYSIEDILKTKIENISIEYFNGIDNNYIKEIYDTILNIYTYSKNKFIDIWIYLKSNKYLRLDVFLISIIATKLIYELSQSNLNFETFSYYIQNIISKYSSFNIESIYDNQEINEALKNCNQLNFIPERVFSNSIEKGIKYSTAYLFNRICSIIFLYQKGDIGDNDDFLLLSGISPPSIYIDYIDIFFDRYKNIYNTQIKINKIILIEKTIKIKDIIPWLINYYRGDISLNEKENVRLINNSDEYYLIENHILYLIYLILGKEMIPCEILEK